MSNGAVVHVLERQTNLVKNELGLVFGDHDMLLHILEKLAALHEFLQAAIN